MSGSFRDGFLAAAIAALATAWRWSAAGLALTLPPGVEFHDGERLDALLAKARRLIAVAERRPLRCEAVDIRRRD